MNDFIMSCCVVVFVAFLFVISFFMIAVLMEVFGDLIVPWVDTWFDPSQLNEDLAHYKKLVEEYEELYERCVSRLRSS